MDKSGEGEPAADFPMAKRAKRCIQSKLSWLMSPRVNGTLKTPPPLSSPAAAQVAENGVKNSKGRMNEGKPKRNTQRKYLCKAFEKDNLRLFDRKQTHPISSLHKATKRPSGNRHFSDMQNTSWAGLDGDYCFSLPPIHVFETLNDNIAMPDWRNWKFLEASSAKSNERYIINFSSLFEGSVEPLKLESACKKEAYLDLLLLNHEGRDPSVEATNSARLSNSLVSKGQLSSHLKMVHVCSDFLFLPACCSSVDKKYQNSLHKGRLASGHQGKESFLDFSLWTDKYRPETSLEVCGNAESVKFFSEWLKSWHENGVNNNQSENNTNYSVVEDNDGPSFDNKSDMDGAHVGNILKNVLLITGPVGSGKSAAIYACAREQGFKVIEINSSSYRNGAYLRQTFGESVDSHGLTHWLAEDKLHQTSEHMLGLQSGLPDVAENGFHVDSNGVGSKLCNQMNSIGNKSAPCQVANKTLLLFEEVDVIFDEDRGFISAIFKLAKRSKRPIVLTSNNRKPVLPLFLDRLVLEFKAPSYQDLLYHASMVCAMEKVHVSYGLLEHIINACLSDIRRILMLLQFWCQGMGDKTGHKTQGTKVSVPFDIDAVHLAIPKAISWDFCCELSQKLEEEISRTVSAVKENSLLMDVAMQHQHSSRISIEPLELNNFSTVENRDEKRLRSKNSLHDHRVFSCHMDSLENHFDFSYSPSMVFQRTPMPKLCTLLSSQSYDELSDDELKPGDTLAQPSGYNNLPSSPTLLISQAQELHGIVSFDQMGRFRMDSEVQNSFDSFEVASTSHVCDTYGVQGVSFVPQSSLVSETETIVSSSFMSRAEPYRSDLTSFFKSNRPICILSQEENNNSYKGVTELSQFSENYVGSNPEFYSESILGNDNLDNIENEVEKHAFRPCPLMDDECSRADFNVWSRNRVDGSQDVASVPETWRKLRDCRDKLKLFLSTNSKDASLIASLTSGLADVISETDIMYQSCNSILYDNLEPVPTPCVEPVSFSWYDEQIEMASTFAQHGLCFYMKCATSGSSLDCNSLTDFGQEVLASSTNSIALGKLLTQNSGTDHNYCLKASDVKTSQAISVGRDSAAELYSAILPVVPARLSMALRGLAFHEYVSFMSQISRLETSRLAESCEEKRKKRRSSLHYLISGAYKLSPEQVDLLARRSCFSKRS